MYNTFICPLHLSLGTPLVLYSTLRHVVFHVYYLFTLQLCIPFTSLPSYSPLRHVILHAPM